MNRTKRDGTRSTRFRSAQRAAFRAGSAKSRLRVESWPGWKRDGKEIFYVSPDRKLMAAEVGVKGGTFDVGQVTVLFGGWTVGPGFSYDVAADGKSFLTVMPPEQSTNAEPLTVVQNWTAGLKKK